MRERGGEKRPGSAKEVKTRENELRISHLYDGVDNQGIIQVEEEACPFLIAHGFKMDFLQQPRSSAIPVSSLLSANLFFKATACKKKDLRKDGSTRAEE